MTILRPLHDAMAARILVAIAGTIGVAFMVRRSGRTLGRIVATGDAADRRTEAVRIILAGAITSRIMVLGGSLANPVGTARGQPAGARCGPRTVRMLGVRFVATTPSAIDEPVEAGRSWLPVAAILVVLLLWFIVGPGVTLHGGAV